MKSLLKIMLPLALAFALTFVVLKLSGLITVAKIELWLKTLQAIDPIYVAVIVVALLFADLFVAVPTLTVMILSGFFLGPEAGAAAAIIGLTCAGFSGYGLSRVYGDHLARFLIRDEAERRRALDTFRRHGPVMILLSRAVPILPEVTACMAGLSGMAFSRFVLLWWLSVVP